MPSRKRKTTAKATTNAIANAITKVIAKATATTTRSAKAKATRARNKAVYKRILQSSIPRSPIPLITSPSGTIDSNSVTEFITARAGKAKEVVNKRYNYNPIPFIIKDYLDSRKPYIKYSLIVNFNSITRLRWDF
ncbi:hypothetical protein NA56DRAFT_646163 [Hyaloscypha hepaticicola]|uniref:Uncharacterized protein n=1 Tax=Hyaloscypha hepaticicola TaxID=2082293 RepID=A0A2J6Q2H2_9HELO|nr:hypothetical protein NA56DRAFT_646163 [Hyaloscypha hepaticicola]